MQRRRPICPRTHSPWSIAVVCRSLQTEAAPRLLVIPGLFRTQGRQHPPVLRYSASAMPTTSWSARPASRQPRWSAVDESTRRLPVVSRWGLRSLIVTIPLRQSLFLLRMRAEFRPVQAALQLRQTDRSHNFSIRLHLTFTRGLPFKGRSASHHPCPWVLWPCVVLPTNAGTFSCPRFLLLTRRRHRAGDPLSCPTLRMAMAGARKSFL